jgi:regulator of replication initiation timing
MYYNEEFPYYEPSIADEILMEYQEKMKNALLESVKSEISNLKDENNKLKEENEKLKIKIMEVQYKEEELKTKERELEKEFYRKKFSEMLKPYEKQMVVWIAEYETFLADKCNLCDDDRKITYTAPDGSTIKLDCKCKKYYSLKVPTKVNVIYLDLFKDDFYSKDRRFIITPKYESREYDSKFAELRVSYVFDVFNPEDVENLALKYGCYIGFTSKEECQKYCDWVNKKEQ